MKRILFFIVMTLCAMTTFAQETKEQIQKSEERAKNLQILLDKYSDTNCGDGIIDGFGNSVRDAAVLAIANSVKLEGLYYRQIGQTKDGVTDVPNRILLQIRLTIVESIRYYFFCYFYHFI